MNATADNQVIHIDVGTVTNWTPNKGRATCRISGINPIAIDAGRSSGSLDMSAANCQSYLKCLDTLGGSYFMIVFSPDLRKSNAP
jgi:hypothetical protein